MHNLIIPTIFSLFLLNAFTISDTKHIVENNNMTKCELCKDIVELITYDVKNGNKTFHDIVDLIEDLCKIIGGPVVAKECKFFLSELTKVEELIVKGYNATYICQDIHMCPKTKFIKC